MKKLHLSALALLTIILFSFTKSEGDTNYKCMMQMVNYTGENAYVVVSLLSPEGKYTRTLSVHGKDEKWYADIIGWWGHQKKAKQKIDGVTGASIAGGQRAMDIVKIPSSLINKGYKIRVESAVESQSYHKQDIEFEYKTENINQKMDGKGYVKYIRLMPA